MITIETVRNVCIARGLRELCIGKIPTWIDKNNNEGIEWDAGKIRTFWINDMDRVYGEPASNEIEITVKLINVEDIESKPSENIQEPEAKGISFLNQLPAVLEGKRIIVPQDIDELKQMSTFDRIMLFQRTPQQFVKVKNGRGGKQHYVEGNVMKMEANIAFLFKVGGKIDGWHIDEKGVTCYGSLTVDIDGVQTTIPGVGIDLQEYRKEDKSPVLTTHEMMKNACTDMKKKILADMGFNGDVYRGEYD